LTVLVSAHEAGVRRVIYASSSSVYGGATELPTPESAPLVPRSPYAVSKLAGEQYCQVFWELFGLETVCLRYFNVYGPRQRPDSRYAAVIPLFIDALRHGRPLEIHSDGRQSRSFTYVSDVIAANFRAATMPAERCAGRIYNISGGKPYTLSELVSILEKLLGVTAKVVHTEPRAGDIRHSWAAIDAAAQDLEHRPSVEFSEGLSRTLEWHNKTILGSKSTSTSASKT
jgi:UDP-glucose 4-epimerase